MSWFRRRRAVPTTVRAQFTNVYTFPPVTISEASGPLKATIGVFYLKRSGENTLCFGIVAGPDYFLVKGANTVDHAYRAALLLLAAAKPGLKGSDFSPFGDLLSDCSNAALARLEWPDSLRPGGLAHAVAELIGVELLRSLRAQPIPDEIVAAQLKHAQQ